MRIDFDPKHPEFSDLRSRMSGYQYLKVRRTRTRIDTVLRTLRTRIDTVLRTLIRRSLVMSYRAPAGPRGRDIAAHWILDTGWDGRGDPSQ